MIILFWDKDTHDSAVKALLDRVCNVISYAVIIRKKWILAVVVKPTIHPTL